MGGLQERSVDILEKKEIIKANKNDVIAKDLPRFMKDYKKFRKIVDEEGPDGGLKRTLNKIDSWVGELDRRGGLPAS